MLPSIVILVCEIVNRLNFVGIGLNVPIAHLFMKRAELVLKSEIGEGGGIGCCLACDVVSILD